MRACPEATFFHRVEWRGIYESVFNHRTHYLLAERAGEVTGVLPLVEMRSLLFGHSLCSLPFALYGGVHRARAKSRDLWPALGRTPSDSMDARRLVDRVAHVHLARA